MALLWFDGFETYNDENDMKAIRNSIINSITTDSVSPGSYGRRSSRGIRLADTNRYLRLYLANNYVSFLIGIALYQDTNNIPTYDANNPFLGFYDDTTLQIGFYGVGTEIHVYSNGVKLGQTTDAGISYETWRYVEVKFTIDNSVGTVEIHVDGIERMTPLTSQDTQNTANAYFNMFRLGNPGGNNYRFDDFYMGDLTGVKNNDFLGDVRVDVILPDGEGTYNTYFTPSSAGDNNLMVDETYPDDDSTYNQGSSVGDKDTYTLSALPSPPAAATIHGVKSQITVRKTDAGSRECKILTRTGTTDTLGDTIVLSESYLTPTKIYENNPADSAAFEDADVNGMEVGVEITV